MLGRDNAMRRCPISQKPLKVLFARSYNQCAFPSCMSAIVDPKTDAVYGEVCHIGGVELRGNGYEKRVI